MLNSGYCRLCAELKTYSNLLVIKDEDEHSKNLCYQISQCFQIQISVDDNLPKTICLECCTQTSVTYEFFNKVQRAQEFLRNVIYKPLINNNPPITFIQPVVGLISNENNIEDLIEARVKNDTGAEQDVQHSDSDELWDYESSTDSTNVQSSSTSKIVDKSITKVDKQPQKYRACKVIIKNEINSNEASGLQTHNTNEEKKSTEKTPVTRKRKRNKKIRESKQKICKDDDNHEICGELKDYTWNCNVCFDKLETRQDLIEHFQQKHNKPVEYSCSDCPRTLSNYTVFVQHVRRHQLKFCCEQCGKTFHEKRYLRRHVKYVHGHIEFKCDICNKVYKSNTYLNTHKKSHLPKSPEPVTFPCKICRKKLPTENDLIEHQIVHDESNKPFICDKCGWRFRQQRILDEHVENKHTEYSKDQYIQCPLCPTKFKFKRHLARHKRIVHFPKKSYECQTCGKKFNLQTEYKRHLMIHTGERPFKCGHCDKSFRIKAHLKIHNRQHTGEKPYCCSECKHDFADFSNYIKHMRSKHGVTSFKNIKKITDGKTAS